APRGDSLDLDAGTRFAASSAAGHITGAASMKPRTYLVATSLLIFAGSAHAQTAPTDAQIASIVVTANQVDIDAAKLAETKASSKEVKDFARRMVIDHSALNKSATELAQKLKLKPESNSTSEALKKGGDENLAKLKTLSGADFDRAYIDNEVKYHQAVLD